MAAGSSVVALFLWTLLADLAAKVGPTPPATCRPPPAACTRRALTPPSRPSRPSHAPHAPQAGIHGPGVSGLAAKVPGFQYIAGAEYRAKAGGSEGGDIGGELEGDVTTVKTVEA